MKRKNILIFGANGILGNIIFKKLLNNYNVIGFSHKSSRNKNIIKTNYRRLSKNHRSIIKNADVMINCIGENSNEKNMSYKNIYVLKLISNEINRYSYKKTFIHLSTCGVYGFTYSDKISEKINPMPNTVYSKTKLNGEKILKQNLNQNIKLIVLRSSQVIGKNMRNISLIKLIYFLNKRLFFFVNNKNSEFSYIFSEDLISSIKLLIKKKNNDSKTYNISNNIKYHKLVKIILKVLNKQITIPNFNPKLIKLLIFLLDKLKIQSPLNYQSFNSLRSKKIFRSNKIKKDLNIKKFININATNLKELIND